MEKIKVIFQVQGCESDNEYADYSLDGVWEEIIDEDKIEDKIQEILQYTKKHPKHHIHDKYIVTDVMWFDLKGKELYRDEDSFHHDFWEYMVDNNLGVDDRLTREED